MTTTLQGLSSVLSEVHAEGEDVLRAAIALAPIGIAVLDVVTGQPPVLIDANGAFCQLYGRPLSQLVGRGIPVSLSAPSGHLPVPWESSPRLDVLGPRDWGEGLIVRPDGARRWVHVQAVAVPTLTGRQFWVSSWTDVTSQRLDIVRQRASHGKAQRSFQELRQAVLPDRPVQTPGVDVVIHRRRAAEDEWFAGWVDAVPLPGERVGVFLGDVPGGSPAALVASAQLRSLTRTLASSGLTPSGVLRRVNDLLHTVDLVAHDGPISLTHIQIDPNRMVAVVAAAGGLPVNVLDRDTALPTRRFPAAQDESALLGTVPGLVYPETVIPLGVSWRVEGLVAAPAEPAGTPSAAALIELTSTGRGASA